MARTQAALEIVLTRNLATIAHEYLQPSPEKGQYANTGIDYGVNGHYELAMQAIYQPDGPYETLIGACSGGNIVIVEAILIRKHFDDVSLNSPMWRACNGGYLDIVKLLIRYGSTNLGYGLSAAINRQHHDVIKYLTERGVTPKPLW